MTVALAFHFAPFPWPANRFDAGIGVVAAQRVLRGEVPYVDFQTLYTPGRYYVYAAAFRVFGTHFDVASRVDFAVMAVQAWLAWHVAARLSGSRFVALLAFAAGLAFAYPYPSLAIVFVALLVAERGVRTGSFALVLVAGGVAGVAAWFRQDVGGTAVTAVALTALCGWPGDGRARMGRVFAVALATAAVLVLLLLPALVSAPSRLADGLVENPAATIPFRSSKDGLLAVFHEEWFFGVIAVMAALGGLLGVVRALRRPERSSALLGGVAVMTLWAARYLCLRPETHHLVPAGILVGVLGATPWPRATWPRLPAFVVCAAATFVPFVRSSAARASHLVGRRAATVATLGDSLPGSSTLFLPVGEIDSYRRLIDAVRAHSSPGEPILSACARHDFVHTQDLLLYFVADRPAVAFDWHFDPGVTTREDVQLGIVSDCERADVRVVVRYDSPLGDAVVTAPSGSRVLDEWIAANFVRSETIGRYEVWLRR